MTAKQLGDHLGISSATVVRFAHKIGFTGYPELRREVQKLFREENEPMKKLKESFNGPLETKEAFEMICALDQENISLMLSSDLGEELGRAMEIILNADTLLLFGGRSTYSLVHYAGFLLRQLDKKFGFFNSCADDAYERMEDLSPKDAVFVISFHRYYQRTIELAFFAHEKGSPVISLTDSIQSPLVPISTVSLMVPNKAPFYSYVAPMTVLNGIIATYAKKAQLSSKEIFLQRNKMLLQKGIYA